MTTAEFPYRVIDREERFSGRMFSIVTDEVTMPDGASVAVTRLAYID